VTGWISSDDERAEAYLEGELSRDEAAAFERDLAGRPEAADALEAAVLLRDLLGRLPPLHPPPGLEQRIVDALPLERRGERSAGRKAERGERRSAAPTLRAALAGASWLVRAPAAVMQGGMAGARPLTAGLTQVRWVLGPLAARRAEPEPLPRRPVWRRIVEGLGEGLGRLR
jgi:anti-sigma factor RsiW